MPKNETLLGKTLGRFGLELRGSQASGRSTERRSSLENPQTPLSYPAEWLLDIFNGGRTDSGLRVSEMTALNVTTLYQCVMIIANGIAAFPFLTYESLLTDNRSGKRVAYKHPLFDLLANAPNEEMTSSTWRRTMQCHALLWGNAYSEIQRDGAARPTAIWPRNPSRTRPVRLTESCRIEGTLYPIGTMVYETYDSLMDSQIRPEDTGNMIYGNRRIVLAEDMLHVPGLSLDGRVGQDVVTLGRQAIGLALAEEKYGAKFFGNGAVPQGLLSVPGDMTDVQWDTLRRSWAEAHGGENAQRTGVLPPGVVYTKTGALPNEGQMIEARQHQKAEMASLFNVPGHMVGVNGDDAGKSTVEQSSLEFKLYCLGPWSVSWEQECKRKLFPNRGAAAGKYFAGFDFRELTYPDAASRSTLYGSGKQWGYLTTNDIRELEKLNPIPGAGDKLWMPTNMVDAEQAAAHSEQVQSGLDDGTLAATPSGTTPVGNHPVVKDKMRMAKETAKARQQQASLNGQNQPGKNAEPGKPTNSKAGRGGSAKKNTRSDVAKMVQVAFRDAVGRAANRNKPGVSDFVTIFGPVVDTAARALFTDDVSIDEFVSGYAEDVFKRAVQWNKEDLNSVALQEQELLIAALERADA